MLFFGLSSVGSFVFEAIINFTANELPYGLIGVNFFPTIECVLVMLLVFICWLSQIVELCLDQQISKP